MQGLHNDKNNLKWFTKKKHRRAISNSIQSWVGCIQPSEKYLHLENIWNHKNDSNGCLLAMGLAETMFLTDHLSSYLSSHTSELEFFCFLILLQRCLTPSLQTMVILCPTRNSFSVKGITKDRLVLLQYQNGLRCPHCIRPNIKKASFFYIKRTKPFL